MDTLVTKKRAVVPDAAILAKDLRTMRVMDVAAKYDISPSAVCVKLRRAGMPRGESIQKKPSGKPKVEAPQVAAEANYLAADRVVRVTFSGARVTMPRVTFIDGPSEITGKYCDHHHQQRSTQKSVHTTE